ncbi:MAG: sugar phosphate nucleotidyltransferase [Streptosporangiaceae bacterium]
MAVSPEHAIIMAGGKGSRLHPHTMASPKPLITMGGGTILGIIIKQLRSIGVSRITLCVWHLADMIMDEFGDGSRLGVEVDYCVDPVPRGTAGPLADVPGWTRPAVVMNADVLTRLNFADLFTHHITTSALLTVAAHAQELVVDYGVLQVARDQVVALVEKPTVKLNVSAGIYVASPEVREFVPAIGWFGMNDLVRDLIGKEKPVHAYQFSEEWFDIGTPERLAEARRSLAAMPAAYLPESIREGHYTPT